MHGLKFRIIYAVDLVRMVHDIDSHKRRKQASEERIRSQENLDESFFLQVVLFVGTDRLTEVCSYRVIRIQRTREDTQRT